MAIKAGATLEEAMTREPQIFNTLFLSMIRVAEARGGVPETLRMMGNHYEARLPLIRQARLAMIYPVIVLIMAGGVISHAHPFSSSHVRVDAQGHRSENPAPPPQSRPPAFSGFVSWIGWWLIPLAMIGTPFLIYRFYKTSVGKSLLDRLILRTPVFGPSAASWTSAGLHVHSRPCSTPEWTSATR